MKKANLYWAIFGLFTILENGAVYYLTGWQSSLFVLGLSIPFTLWMGCEALEDHANSLGINLRTIKDRDAD